MEQTIINFEFFNSDTQEKVENITLSNFFLWEENLRYTLMTSLEMKLQDKISKQKIDSNSQNNILLELLKNEGNFKDFLTLLKSFEENSFTNLSDPLLCVKHNSHKENFVVAEGNRRMMVLKMIANLFSVKNLDNIDNLSIDIPNQNDEELDAGSDTKIVHDSSKIVKSNLDNSKKILEFIKKKWKGQIEPIKIWVKFIRNEEELYSLIFDKHNTGQKPGMRKWPRAKYFADLLNMFPEGIKEEINKKIFRSLGRDPEKVKIDYRQAQLIFHIFLFGKGNFVLIPKFLKYNEYMTLLEEIKNSKNISALESPHTLTKIRSILSKSYLNFEDYIKIEYEENNHKMSFNFSNLFSSKQLAKLFRLLYTEWKEEILTTRPIKTENEMDFNKKVLDIFKNKKNIDELIDDKKFENFDWISLSKNDIKKVLKSNSTNWLNDNQVKIANKIIEIQEDNIKIIKKISEESKKIDSSYVNSPVGIFQNLMKQYESLGDNHLNGLASTIRSTFEQIQFWGSHYPDKKINLISNNTLKHNFFNSKANNYIQLLKNKEELENEIEAHKNLIKTLFKDSTKIRKLQAFIHSGHKFYGKSKFFYDYLETFREWQIAFLGIFQYIDFSKFQKINEKIKLELDVTRI